MTRRKNELEKRVEELIGEREQLNSTLEETSDKIVMLERHAREQDCQVMKMYLNGGGKGGPGVSIFGFQFSTNALFKVCVQCSTSPISL